MGYYHRWNYIIVVIHSVDNICGYIGSAACLKGFRVLPPLVFSMAGAPERAAVVSTLSSPRLAAA